MLSSVSGGFALNNFGRNEMDLTYNLPDQALLETAGTYIINNQELLLPHFWLDIFVPNAACLVIGQSNKPDVSLAMELAIADGVKIIRRPSGGEAVFLSQQVAVIAFAAVAEKLVKSSIAFHWILDKIRFALSEQGVMNISQRGISDLAIGDKKILGCSIYRRPHLLFYHAVLNLSEKPENIARYLLHPNREPDYRQHRAHHEFVTSLALEGYSPDLWRMKTTLSGVCAQSWQELVCE